MIPGDVVDAACAKSHEQGDDIQSDHHIGGSRQVEHAIAQYAKANNDERGDERHPESIFHTELDEQRGNCFFDDILKL